MDQTLVVELARERAGHYYFADFGLPASGYQIRDAFQRARIEDPERERFEITILECRAFPRFSDIRLDDATVLELDFFARRLGKLGEEERAAFRAVVTRYVDRKQGHIRMKDLINLTYGLAGIVYPGVRGVEELGRFLVENELLDEEVPKEIWHLMDLGKIGEQHCQLDCGVFLEGRYIAAGQYQIREVYDGKLLPGKKNVESGVFRIKITAGEMDGAGKAGVSEWVSLPMGAKEEEQTARMLHQSRMEDCVLLEFESFLPQITGEQFSGMGEFALLNRLAVMISRMEPEDLVKFQAVLSAEKPKNLKAVFEAADHLSEYGFSYYSDSAGSFFKEYLRYHLSSGFDSLWLDRFCFSREGERLLQRLGAVVTDYGVVSARGESLYRLVSYEEPVECSKEELAVREFVEEGSTQAGMLGGM